MEGLGQNETKTYTGECLDTRTFDGDDERRRCGRSAPQSKARVIRGYEQANDGDAANIEK